MDLKKFIAPSNIYFYSVLLLAASLPLSIFTTSLAEIILLVNWIREGDFRNKWELLKKRKAVFFIIALYLLHIIGLVYTQQSNWHYAMHDLKIKLPVLILPVIFASSEGLNHKKTRIILLLFSTATIVSTLISLAVFVGIIPYEFYDFRDISIFISHIRLALMVNLSIFILMFYIFNRKSELRLSPGLQVTYGLFIFWLIFFLVLLKSITGLMILTCLTLVLGWYYSSDIKDIAPRFIIRVFIITIPLIIASYITGSISKFYQTEKVNFSSLEEYTPSGNPYVHDTLRKARENGNYVWLYLCEKELEKEWNQISSIPYDGKDNKDQRIKYTLIRYLTSIGERKDSAGVSRLTGEDIRAIENGKANRIFTNKYRLYPRIYEIIWEIDGYLRGGDPSGHSIAQRIAYLNAAKSIIRHNWIIGVGTGDVQKSFNDYYESTGSKLAKNFRRRAHNQYVTFFLSFGVIGFIWSMLAIFLPIFIEKKWGDYLFIVFFTIAAISMLNEDTLETQTGVSFFIYFYAFLLFARKPENHNG